MLTKSIKKSTIQMMDFWRKSDDNMLKVEESICLLIHLDSEEKECFFNVILGKRCDPDLGIGTNITLSELKKISYGRNQKVFDINKIRTDIEDYTDIPNISLPVFQFLIFCEKKLKKEIEEKRYKYDSIIYFKSPLEIYVQEMEEVYIVGIIPTENPDSYIVL